jgi:hypothetical protein
LATLAVLALATVFALATAANAEAANPQTKLKQNIRAAVTIYGFFVRFFLLGERLLGLLNGEKNRDRWIFRVESKSTGVFDSVGDKTSDEI